jgi:hypothetical protein
MKKTLIYQAFYDPQPARFSIADIEEPEIY